MFAFRTVAEFNNVAGTCSRASIMTDHGEALAQFISFTGADDAKAVQLLEASDWNVETAVGLYFASGQEEHDAGSHPPRPAPMEEDEVRAPMPTKVERLYGDDAPTDRIATGMGVPLHFGPRGVQRAQPPVTAFSDKGSESSCSGLSGLFKAPSYAFLGGFEMAKARAMEDGKWLLLNIQHQHEFRWAGHAVALHACYA